MQKFRRMLVALTCIIVGLASFALSYEALQGEAVRVGAVRASMAWLIPLVIDGGVICGSAVIWSMSKETSRRPLFPFVFVGTMVTFSVIVNISHAGPSLMAKVIAALPPLVLLGTLELVAKYSGRVENAAPEVGASVPAPTHEAPMPESPAPQAGVAGEEDVAGPDLSEAGPDLSELIPAPRRETKPAAKPAVKPAGMPVRRTKASGEEGSVVAKDTPVKRAPARKASSRRPVRVVAEEPELV